MGGASPWSARPRPWLGRLTIGLGWDGSWPEWPSVLRLTGDHDGAMAAGQQVLALATDARRPCLAGPSLPYAWGRSTGAIGDFGRAAELLRWSVEAADREAGTPSTDVQIRVPGVCWR